MSDSKTDFKQIFLDRIDSLEREYSRFAKNEKQAIQKKFKKSGFTGIQTVSGKEITPPDDTIHESNIRPGASMIVENENPVSMPKRDMDDSGSYGKPKIMDILKRHGAKAKMAKAEAAEGDLEEIEHGSTLTHYNAPHGQYEVHKDMDGHHVTYTPHGGKDQYLGASQSALSAGMKVERHHTAMSKKPVAKAEPPTAKPPSGKAPDAPPPASKPGAAPKAMPGAPKASGGAKPPMGVVKGEMAKAKFEEGKTNKEKIAIRAGRRPNGDGIRSQKGLHAVNDREIPGTSIAGRAVNMNAMDHARDIHHRVIAEQKAMPKPNLPKSEVSLEKGIMSDVAHKEAKDMGAPVAAAPKLAMPKPAQHAQRANAYASAMGGAFEPKSPVSSGLELDRPMAAKTGLKPPSAAGVAPKKGVFGKLGKKEVAKAEKCMKCMKSECSGC